MLRRPALAAIRTISHTRVPVRHFGIRPRQPPRFIPKEDATPSQLILDALRFYDHHYRTTLRTGLIGVFTVSSVGWWYRHQIYEVLGGESAKVVKHTMENEELIQQTHLLVRNATDELLKNPDTVQVTVSFLLELLQNPDTKKQTADLLYDIMADPTTIAKLKRLMIELFQDPTMRDELAALLADQLKRPEVVSLLKQMFIDLFRDEDIIKAAAQFAQKALSEQVVYDQAADIGKETVRSLGSDPDFLRDAGRLGKSTAYRTLVPEWLVWN